MLDNSKLVIFQEGIFFFAAQAASIKIHENGVAGCQRDMEFKFFWNGLTMLGSPGPFLVSHLVPPGSLSLPLLGYHLD